MSELQRFRRRSVTDVVAVQLKLETQGFAYQKWGATQTCKAGDYLVENAGDVYTVDRDTFETTYEAVGHGVYRKKGFVWARVAEEPGAIRTKEGETHYEAGDYLVFNDPNGWDGYAIKPQRFDELYEPIS
jgi:hypothetical protein